jgi:hypothetical protein
MNLDEALAIYLYTKDNTEAWAEPVKSVKAEAWQVICKYAQASIALREALQRVEG